METLEEEEEGEERHEAGAEVVPEDGEGQTSLGDRIPGSFQKVLGVGQGTVRARTVFLPGSPAPTSGPPPSYLHLRRPQLPEEHLAHHLAQQEDKNEGLDVQDLGAQAMV